MSGDEDDLLNQSELEALLGGAISDPGTSSQPPPTPRSSRSGSPLPKPFELDEIAGSEVTGNVSPDLSLILDVDLNVRVELGRTKLFIEDVVKLRQGAVVPLDKLAGDPVDIFVNDRLMARGEVLVLNDNFCVRISEIIGENSGGGLQDE